MVADVNPESGTNTVKSIKDAGGEAIFASRDISQADQVEATVVKTVERYGRLNFTLNNAGASTRPDPTADVSEDDWRRVIEGFALSDKPLSQIDWLLPRLGLMQMISVQVQNRSTIPKAKIDLFRNPLSAFVNTLLAGSFYNNQGEFDERT